MHFIPLSVLAAALMAAAAPSPERAEITIKVDLTSDNDAATNIQALLDSTGLDIEVDSGDRPNLSDWKFNLHYNFSLLAHVTGQPEFPGRGCRKSPKDDLLLVYRPGEHHAEFGPDKTNFTLCHGELLYDHFAFTVGTEEPLILLGQSANASTFETVTIPGNGIQKDRLYIQFNNRNFWFGSSNCPPQRGDRVAALSGQGDHSMFFLVLFSLSLLTYLDTPLLG